jgi:hypothetical protein
MSALVLHKIKKGSAFSTTCEESGCNGRGRFRVEIAGRPMLSHKSFGKPEQAQLCEKCGKAWRKLWRELNGEQLEGAAKAAIRSLIAVADDESGKAQVQRTDAIDSLIELGFDSDAVLHAQDGALDGLSVEEILNRLVGVGEVIASV